MADLLIRRSPLQGYESRFSALPDSVRLAEEPFCSMVDLWVDPAGAGGAPAAGVLGLDVLPVTPATVTSAADAEVIWFGPQEWLITSTVLAGEDLEARLREAVGSSGGAAVDVSAQRSTLRLSGQHARAILAKGCSLDLHPGVLGPGAAAQTTRGLAAGVLSPLGADGTDYRILVRSSFARYLAEWLIDAAEEFGVDWQP